MKIAAGGLLAFALGLQDVAGHVIARSATSTSATATATAVKNTGKRGLAYNDPKLTLPFSLSGQVSQVSWAYNWNYQESNMANFNPALEYIPLLYNNNPDLLAVWPTTAQAAIDNGSTALMSFNEPDFSYSGSGSNYMDVATAVETWQKYMEPFAGKALLVAPAITNVGAPAGLTWLQDFIDACTNCTIDVINLHWYSNKWAGAAYLESHVESARAVADGRPIWISEFGLDDSDGTYSDDDLHSFLETAMTWLDAQDDIHRYAYFMDTAGMLINSAGTGMSDTGVLYNNYTTGSTSSSSATSAASSTPTSSSTKSISTTSTSVSATTTTKTTTSAASTPTIQILSAYFATTDVTLAAQSSLLTPSGNLVVDTSSLSSLTSGTDPWWGVLKTLSILYTANNKTYIFVATEQSGTYTITPSSPLSANAVEAPTYAVPSDSPIQIASVAWGAASIATESVWMSLYAQAGSGWGFQIGDTLFGVDTLWGHEKSAVMWYYEDEVLKALVGKEDEWVKF